jgi:uncharacterized protein (DUF427 family)
VSTEPLSPSRVESVWDYPRPPVVVPTDEHVVVATGSVVVADTRRAVRVLETSHPPVYYLPRADVAPGLLSAVAGTTYCEFKGRASYFDLVCPSGRVLRRVAWHYPAPSPGFEVLVGYCAFYPGRLDRCTVDGEPVQAQEGDFYGGWVTSRVSGPFKGGPGTLAW